MPREEVRRHFDRLRWDDPPEFEEYWVDVQRTREQGYALDRDHFVRGITTIAAPVISKDSGTAIMAISAIGFSGQFTDGSIAALAEELTNDANEIGAAVSFGTHTVS